MNNRVHVKGVWPSQTTYRWNTKFPSVCEAEKAYKRGEISWAIPGRQFRELLHVDGMATVDFIASKKCTDAYALVLDKGIGESHEDVFGKVTWDTIVVYASSDNMKPFFSGESDVVKVGY